MHSTRQLYLAGLALCALTALAGCMPQTAVVHESPSRNEQGDTYTLMRYASQLRGRNDYASELESLNRAYAQRRTEYNRLRLAIFHSLAPSHLADHARAIALLDLPPGESYGRGRNHPIAQMLLPLLQELRRQEEALATAQQSNSTAQQRLRDEQKRSEALQQKIDAIRDIEKKMLDRPAGNNP